MIRKLIFIIIWALIVALLIVVSTYNKSSEDAMLAQVESEVTAVSYRKPVLIKNVFVTPGQIVDSGDLLIEVERPDLTLDFDKLNTQRIQLEISLNDKILAYRNSMKIITADFESEISELISRKNEIEYELGISKENLEKINSVASLEFQADNKLRLDKIQMINKQIENLNLQFNIRKNQLLNDIQSDTFFIQSDLEIVNKEIEVLNKEKSQLSKRAEKSGTIGNVYVQLNELVPPYKTLISIYDLNPTLIKAFINETAVQELKIGSKVMVESIHKQNRTEGTIIEIGSRVTSYPDKINPLLNQKSYGQEIFINIPNTNHFLNGEKVYVYVIEE